VELSFYVTKNFTIPEQKEVQYFSMKMTTPRISRGAKSRVFLYIGAVIFVGITVIIIHETQTRVEDIRKSSEKCQQQQESLAAQLQGIYNHNIKSLRK
jgi:membrane-anchored glycerophosphoryl diester phosphodiesterase (GDPDase)